MTRWKLTIEYKGSDYSGWQRQDGVPSIQQSVEEAITGFSGQTLRLHGAGRTDAGVHARGQVAHVDFEALSQPMEGFEIAKAINAYLRPQPISVVNAEQVDEEFHARYHAKNKHYQYCIVNRPAFLALDRGLAWHLKRPLDVEAMHDAAQILLGAHDFTTFRDSQCQAKSPEKSLTRLDVSREGDNIIFDVEGPSFLHHQVRNMVGSLTFIGEGKWTKADLKAALEMKDRTKGGPTAPSDGLYLLRIDY